MRLRTIVWATVALVALGSGASSALAFDPQPDPPARQSIKEKVHLPIYDSVYIEQTGR
jgi:hypothetical protein